jgi:hypothetical protein
VPTNSPQTPNLVWAKSPVSSGYKILICHPQTIDKISQFGSRSIIGEYWGLVHGNPGAMPDGFFAVKTDGLMAPAAIFKGLKRPLHYVLSSADSTVYIYVSDATNTYSFRSSTYGNAVMTEPRPIDSVFTTFVSFEADHIDDVTRTMGKRLNAVVHGVVLYWEWTECSKDEPHLPNEYSIRYGSRVL